MDDRAAEDAMNKALLDVVAKIPPTWTCLECGRELDNSPDGVMPWARRTSYDEKGQQFIVGDLCYKCCHEK